MNKSHLYSKKVLLYFFSVIIIFEQMIILFLEIFSSLLKNVIKSIYSSIAIKANSLSLSQVRDVINGHTVLGPQREIQEVKNAIN